MIAASVTCAGLLAVFGMAGPGAVAATAGPTPWPSAPAWQQYDQTPTSATVCPAAVTSTAGTVAGATNLLCGGSGGATLTMVSGGVTPSIVLDYGKEVGGIPYFDVASANGTPTLRAGYSEGLQYLSAKGDAAAPWAEGDSNRYDDYAVSGPGTITNQYVQGGERYEEITLTSPGSVTLSGAGITYIADRTQASGLVGWFNSSDSRMNQIWYDSEYTDQLDSVPAGSLPAAWSVGGGVLHAGGDTQGKGVGLLDTGSSWGDYSVSFQTDVVANQAGWVVRGTDVNDGYAFILDDSTDTSGTPNTLQEWNVHGGTYTSLGTVALSTPLVAGTWHTVSTAVSGSAIRVSLDGAQLTTLTDSTHPAGTIGFREYSGETADFKNLTVTDNAGSTLFSDPLSSSSALSAFSVPGTNQTASIIDGAKRDRAVWSGDMNVEIPGVFYSTDNATYVKGALQLLGSYAHQDGSAAGDIPPQSSLGTSAQAGSTWFYSADYSTYFVLGLADYYRYSGDTAFVQQELPVLKAELAWNATLLDSNGLMVTSSGDNRDWDYYDSGKNGEVTAYNVLYYKSLLGGATLAGAVGDTSDATTYTDAAAALKKAINAHLYNSINGLYYLSNNDTATVAQDANALAVLYGVAPSSDVSTILAALKTDLWSTYGPKPFTGTTYADIVSPFISGYELDARLASNDTADAETLLSTVWGHMIAPGPVQTGTMWENISGSTGLPGFGGVSSLAHGWATTPVSALSGYVLGVQPATAGYAAWTVQPHPGDLQWAQGSVPTPHGAIAVDWAGESGVSQFSMRVTAPAGTTGTIAVPTYGTANPIVEVNGQTVWSNGAFTATAGITGASADSNYVYLTGVAPGRYTVASNPSGYAVPMGYTKCAVEGGTCTVSGTQSVAYGANGIYSYTTASSTTPCDDTTLGDPNYGIAKSCYVGPITAGPANTTYCAPQNGLCSYSGTRTVYYGAGSTWTSKSIPNGTPCTNAVFGDPDSGVVKSCFLAPSG